MRLQERIFAGQRHGLGAEIGEARFGVLTLAGGSEEFSGCKGGSCVSVDEIVEETIQGIALVVFEDRLTKSIVDDVAQRLGGVWLSRVCEAFSQ